MPTIRCYKRQMSEDRFVNLHKAGLQGTLVCNIRLAQEECSRHKSGTREPSLDALCQNGTVYCGFIDWLLWTKSVAQSSIHVLCSSIVGGLRDITNSVYPDCRVCLIVVG